MTTNLTPIIPDLALPVCILKVTVQSADDGFPFLKFQPLERGLEAPDTSGLFGRYLISAVYDNQSVHIVSTREENKRGTMHCS